MKKSLYTILTFARINTRRVFRDKTALFFSIGFPLIFLFVFGSINSGNGNVSFNVALINQSKSESSTQFIKQANESKVLKVDKDTTTIADAKDKMSKSVLDATIVLPEDYGTVKPGESYPSGQAQILYTQNNAQSASALASIIGAQFGALNRQLTGSDEPFTVTSTMLAEKSLTAFDYTFAGLLGFAIVGMGIFGPINVFPELKKMGILRRLSTTPLKVWQYFVATALGQLVIGALSFTLMFVIAVAIFHLHVVGNPLFLGLFITLSLVMILGIGLALGGWAKNERQVAPLANIIVFPMLFISGSFFPRFIMPDWVQQISNYLPLTPVIDGIRMIATEGKGFTDILPQIGLIGAWLIIIYFIAFRVFRWE